MPDFTLKPTFPMASVIDAAQRKAQIEQQSQTAANQQLVQGLDAIGQVGQSLVDKRMKVAQALALGKQFDIPDNIAKGMDPAQILQVGAIKKGQVDMTMLMSMLHPGFTPNVAPTATPASGTPSTPSNGAILASNSTATPIPAPSPAIPQPATQDIPASAPVPIAAPPAMPKMVNKATVDTAMKMAAANRLEPVVTRAQAEAAGGVKHGTHILPDQSGSDNKEQDRLEQNAMTRVAGVRGDASMARIESQRDAASIAYNTIQGAKNEGRPITQTEYYDTLGQLWKARTGAAPTDQSIRDLDINTIQAALHKKLTWVDGQPRGATTDEIVNALQKFVDDSGRQADRLHEGYMKSHLIKPFGLSQERWDNIKNTSRGLSFEEATTESRQAKPAVSNPSAGWNQSNEQRLQMLLEKQKNGSIKS